MSRFKFRGIDKITKEFIYGNLIIHNKKGKIVYYIQDVFDYRFPIVLQEVIPETVGQSTGLFDKNGNEIFEGDVLQYDYEIKIKGIVKWIDDEALFSIHYESGKYGLFAGEDMSLFEVIGNIHEEAWLWIWTNVDFIFIEQNHTLSQW